MRSPWKIQVINKNSRNLPIRAPEIRSPTQEYERKPVASINTVHQVTQCVSLWEGVKYVKWLVDAFLESGLNIQFHLSFGKETWMSGQDIFILFIILWTSCKERTMIASIHGRYSHWVQRRRQQFQPRRRNQPDLWSARCRCCWRIRRHQPEREWTATSQNNRHYRRGDKLHYRQNVKVVWGCPISADVDRENCN